jgi:molybdenum cofactor synthesis domain-containing protein
MVVELINTGTELMLRRVLNSHQQWLCRHLADLGYVVARQVAVSDAARDIEPAVREALTRADLVITTGGLGPTSDDLTRDLIARLLGKELREDAAVLAHIQRMFKTHRRPMPDRTRVQALIPAGATVLANPLGPAQVAVRQVFTEDVSRGQVVFYKQLQSPQDVFPIHALRRRDGTQDAIQSPEPQRVMVWHRQAMMPRRLDLEDDMAAFLVDLPVAEMLAQRSGQVRPGEVPRQLHAQAKTSSRTKCSRIPAGLG